MCILIFRRNILLSSSLLSLLVFLSHSSTSTRKFDVCLTHYTLLQTRGPKSEKLRLWNRVNLFVKVYRHTPYLTDSLYNFNKVAFQVFYISFKAVQAPITCMLVLYIHLIYILLWFIRAIYVSTCGVSFSLADHIFKFHLIYRFVLFLFYFVSYVTYRKMF